MIRHYVNIVTESLRQLKMKAEGSLQKSLKERINICNTCTSYRISNHISRGVSVDVNCLIIKSLTKPLRLFLSSIVYYRLESRLDSHADS